MVGLMQRASARLARQNKVPRSVGAGKRGRETDPFFAYPGGTVQVRSKGKENITGHLAIGNLNVFSSLPTKELLAFS